MLAPLVIVALSVLVIIHEFGHFIVARAFGMRVQVFSIGFGPVLWQWRPKGSETVYQVSAITLLAYVKIAGMSPQQRHFFLTRIPVPLQQSMLRHVLGHAGHSPGPALVRTAVEPQAADNAEAQPSDKGTSSTVPLPLPVLAFSG